MLIAKLKLIQDGLKGVNINYQDSSDKDGKKFKDEHSVKFTSPIHKELRRSMNKLKYHLINMFRMHPYLQGHVNDDFEFIYQQSGNKDYLKAKETWDAFVITGITSNNVDNFLISGKLKCFGNFTTAINTPLITEDANYPYFDKVMEVISEIYEEAVNYVKNGKMADDRQIVIDFHTSNGDQEKLKEVETLSEEQIVAQARQILENKGGIVIMQDDMASESEATDQEENQESEEESGDWGGDDENWGDDNPSPLKKVS